MKNKQKTIYEQDKFSFKEVNSEILKVTPGIKVKLFWGVIRALAIRAVPILVSILISILVNKNIEGDLSILERSLIAIPISIVSLFVLFKLFQIILEAWQRFTFIKVMSEVGSNFSQKAFERLSYLPSEYLIKKDSKEWAFLLNKRNEIINGISLLYLNLMPMIIELIFAILFLIFIGQTILGLISILLIIGSLVFRFKLTGILVKKLIVLFKTQGHIIYKSSEMIDKMYLAKIFHSEDFLVNLRAKEESEEIKLYVRYKYIFNILGAIQDLIMFSVLIVLFKFGVDSVENGELTIGVFIAAFTIMSAALVQLGTSFYMFEGIFALVSAAQPHLEIAKKYKEIGSPTKREIFKKIDIKPIHVQNLGFSYGEKKVLHDVNFKLYPQEKIFLVGLSGSGKTTLINILLGLEKPLEGGILFEDGTKADMVFSVVPQHLDLFSYSIKNNLLLGNPNATEEDLNNALESVNMLKKVNSNGGLDVGIDKFSGGEKQRISIARALISNKPYMLLDEPTSSLDLDNEKIIIEELMSNKELSFVFSTHRLQSIPENAKVIVLENGIISQIGTKFELSQKEGLFNSLINKKVED